MDEVVEVEEEAEEMEEGMVKEEVEANVVVETPAVGRVSEWLRTMMGSRHAGAIQDLPWDPAVLAGPHPPKPGHPPPCRPGESGLDSPVLLVRLHH